MGKTVKILVTLGVIIVFFLIFSAIIGTSNNETPGFLGLIFFAGLIGALTAIWKKPKKSDNNDDGTNNNSILQK